MRIRFFILLVLSTMVAVTASGWAADVANTPIAPAVSTPAPATTEIVPAEMQTEQCLAALADTTERFRTANSLVASLDSKRVFAGLQQVEAAAQVAISQCTGDAAVEAQARLAEIHGLLQAADVRDRKLKTCRPLSDQAVGADIKAATAQSQKKELREIGDLYEQALKLWTGAVDACEGKDKERAQANLDDTGKALAAVALVQGAGVHCEVSNRDAGAMQELAKQASSEKRWTDAAIYFRKTANMWEVATERCTGAQAQQAQTRREQAATDAHNAEFCAPLFEQARETTQEFRNAPGSIITPARQELSRNAEVKWLNAVAQCRGSAAEVAQTNAQRLAKERGTPLPAGLAPVAASTIPRAIAAATDGRVTGAENRAPAEASAARKPGQSVSPTTGAQVGTAAAAKTAAPVPLQLQVVEPGKETERIAGTTRLIGVFKSGPDGAMLNGYGKVIWENGGVYEGAMVDGARTGKGKFVWANGQTYDGEWRNDIPTGTGKLRFASGDVYEGTVADGLPNGTGTMQFFQGDRYSGEFKSGRPDGKGSFVWKNGNRYTGQWVSGMRQGSGTYTWNNGDYWTGEFLGNQQTDNGKLVRHIEVEPKAISESKS